MCETVRVDELFMIVYCFENKQNFNRNKLFVYDLIGVAPNKNKQWKLG